MPDAPPLENPAEMVEFWMGTVLWKGNWQSALSMCTDGMRGTLAGKFVDACIEAGEISEAHAFGAAAALAESDTMHPLWPTFAAYWIRMFRLEAQGFHLGYREAFALESPLHENVMVCPVDDPTLPVWMVLVEVGNGPPRIDGFDDVTGRRIE
jgi:hypothetical protein